ncbi:MAG: MBL fold metallo-hydrolase [Caldimonas sp.]
MNFKNRITASLRGIAPALAVLSIASAPQLARAELTTPVLTINDDAADPHITVQALRDNISVVMGSGGNITVLAGAKGRLLVDAGIASSRPKLEPALNGISAAPIKYLINTHYHWDHTDGNPWVHDLGATIIAHENTLKRVTSGTRVIEWGYTFKPLPAGGLPTVTFKTEKTMDFEGESISIRHVGTGHTDTDAIVYFKQADVLAVGDIWWNGHYPFIDYDAGGGINGLIKEVDACIGASTDRTIIVPGHGEVSNRAKLVRFRDMLVAIRDNVARLKKQGKTVAEAVAARPTAAFDAEYGTFLIDPAFFTLLVYTGV